MPSRTSTTGGFETANLPSWLGAGDPDYSSGGVGGSGSGPSHSSKKRAGKATILDEESDIYEEEVESLRSQYADHSHNSTTGGGSAGSNIMASSRFLIDEAEGGSSRGVGGRAGPSVYLTSGQKLCYLMAHVFGFVAIGLVLYWITFQEMGGGGVAPFFIPGQAGRVFNWHPILMIVSYAFMTVATLAFRMPSRIQSNIGRRTKKFIHGMSWVIVLACGSIGIVAVFQSHNDAVSGYIPNLYSLHSWIGTSVILLYLFQFLVGANVFALNMCSCSFFIKSTILSFHKIVGKFIYGLTGLTVMLGIMEKETFVGCGYMVNGPDTIPFQNLDKIPAVCLVSHGLGISVVLMALCAGYTLQNFPPPQNENRRTNYI